MVCSKQLSIQTKHSTKIDKRRSIQAIEEKKKNTYLRSEFQTTNTNINNLFIISPNYSPYYPNAHSFSFQKNVQCSFIIFILPQIIYKRILLSPKNMHRNTFKFFFPCPQYLSYTLGFMIFKDQLEYAYHRYIAKIFSNRCIF